MAKETILSKKVIQGVREYIKILKRDKLPITKVIVFGSQAKKLARKGSDIDVCVTSPKFKDYFKDLHYLLMKSYQVDAHIEPHPYHPKDFVLDDPLVWEIQHTGIVVE